jgi:hypothetical protein
VTRLLIDERTRTDGEAARTWLELLEGRLALRFDDTLVAIIEDGVFEAVMHRYGKELADDIVVSGPTLELEGGRRVSLFRHRARYDVIAKDFLVFEVPNRAPVAELATSVAAALAHLARLPARD